MSKCPNIHLIVGEDDFLVDNAARKIVAAVVPEENRSSALETVNGSFDNMEEQLRSIRSCEASVQTPPFLDPIKLTWWRSVTFLPGGGRGGKLSEDVKTALEKFAESLAASPLPANQHLLITASKLLVTSVFAKKLKSIAETIVFPSESRGYKKQAAALALLPELAESEGVKFASGADQAFIAKAGTDTRMIVSELSKLHAFIGDENREITADDVYEITSPGGEPELWDITDALGARNAARLVSVFSKFPDVEKMCVLIATVSEKFFRELIIYRDAIDKGWIKGGAWSSSIPEDVKRDLDDTGIGPSAAKNAWAVRKNSEHARNFTQLELRTARWRILRVREKLVSSNATFETLETELLRVIARRRAKK